jgi:hypothetical protein
MDKNEILEKMRGTWGHNRRNILQGGSDMEAMFKDLSINTTTRNSLE